MVNRGRSGGCVTCKQRRVKCDEAKPACQRCQERAIVCEGYVKRPAEMKFRDQSHKFRATSRPDQDHSSPVCRHEKRVPGADMSHNKIPTFSVQDEPPRHLDKADRSQPEANEGQFQDDRCRATFSRPLAQLDVAVPFFLTHYASLGRDKQSARGYFEMLIPVYTTQAQNSALVLAVSAVASEILSLWRHRGDSFRSLRLPYARAVARVRLAVQDPIERRSPATIFAVLALQLYENIASVFGLRSATSVHQNGAASLLTLTDFCDMDLTLREHVRRFMLHTEVAAAMRQKRPLSSIAYSLIVSKNSDVVPENPTSMLDTIGFCVAELQTTAARLFSSADSRPLSIHIFAEVQAEARNLDHQLLSWSQSVPDNWQPQ